MLTAKELNDLIDALTVYERNPSPDPMVCGLKVFGIETAPEDVQRAVQHAMREARTRWA